MTDLTIFYADDDVEDLDFFTDVVRTIDSTIKIHTHDCGQKLIDAMENPPPTPQIIFLDLNMPGKNGFMVLEELRKNSNWKKVPIVIFSTSNDKMNIDKSHELGASFYLPKLGSFEQFKKSILHTLEINWETFQPTVSEFTYKYN